MNKLYIGNLSWTSNEEDLTGLFNKLKGFVSALVILDRETGRSRGFGFVEYDNEESELEAINRYDKFMFKGRPLIVRKALPESNFLKEIGRFIDLSRPGERLDFDVEGRKYFIVRE